MSVSTDLSASVSLYDRALRVMPGGVSRNTILRNPHPLYAAHASGCRVTDIEGVERIDFANNMAALIHGHAYPAVVEAVKQQLGKGTAFTLGTEVEVQFAEHLVGRSPSFERLRFVNSGTEAVMGALKAARAFTGRPKIAKVEGAYHGGYDYAEVSQTSTPSNWGGASHPVSVPVAHGTPSRLLEDVVVLPFNDVEVALEILEGQRDELAAILLDPMPHRVGLAPADPAFVSALRQWSRANDVLLVLDEVITFRSETGGAQTWYGVDPDLTALGKLIGGGFPVGAIAGNASVMEVMNPHTSPVLFPHSGTFSANPITMTAGLVAMQHFDEAAVRYVNGLAQQAIDGIREAIEHSGITACVTGRGSILRVHLKDSPPANYRESFMAPAERRRLDVLTDHLLSEGCMVINTCTMTMSTAMGTPEIEALVAAMERGFDKLVEME